jgi:hypothetical protein
VAKRWAVVRPASPAPITITSASLFTSTSFRR